MARAPSTKTAILATAAALAVVGAAHPDAVIAKVNVEPPTPVGYVEPTTTGNVQVNPPILDDAAILARSKADQAAAAAKAKQEKADKIEAAKKEKADAKAKKDADKAAKAVADEAAKKAKAEQKTADKAARDARMAELAQGRPAGPMLALADKVKQGVYVKSATGGMHSGDALATALDGISATDVIRIGLDVLKLEDNPYAALNVGQQSMNLRNRLRGAIKKDVITIADIAAYVKRNEIVQVTADEIAKAKADREAKAATAKAEREAKATAKAKIDSAGNATVGGKTPGQIDAAAILEGEQNRQGLALAD